MGEGVGVGELWASAGVAAVRASAAARTAGTARRAYVRVPAGGRCGCSAVGWVRRAGEGAATAAPCQRRGRGASAGVARTVRAVCGRCAGVGDPCEAGDGERAERLGLVHPREVPGPRHDGRLGGREAGRHGVDRGQAGHGVALPAEHQDGDGDGAQRREQGGRRRPPRRRRRSRGRPACSSACRRTRRAPACARPSGRRRTAATARSSACRCPGEASARRGLRLGGLGVPGLAGGQLADAPRRRRGCRPAGRRSAWPAPASAAGRGGPPRTPGPRSCPPSGRAGRAAPRRGAPAGRRRPRRAGRTAGSSGRPGPRCDRWRAGRGAPRCARRSGRRGPRGRRSRDPDPRAGRPGVVRCRPPRRPAASRRA